MDSEISNNGEIPAVDTDEHEKEKLEQTITKLEGEVEGLRDKMRYLDNKRKEALNKVLDMKGCIRVFCRIRPILLVKKKQNCQPLAVESDKVAVESSGSRKEFEFDKVFPPEATQDDVFAEAEPILTSALDGHNVCILAYGQTCTGKTFTMNGTSNSPGIVPRALEGLFCQASLDKSASFTFSISMLEVYVGNLRDLLAPKAFRRAYETIPRHDLTIQTDTKGMVEIEGLTEVEISSIKQANWWYSKGTQVRSTSWTNVNQASSRSHCLTRITIFRQDETLGGKKKEVSKLWLVDLGGSERVLKTKATGLTLDEGRAINLSLSSLGDVIAALKRKRAHVPYRNSKLTQILKDSLGDGSKVLMIVHVNQSADDLAETACSLGFGTRARAVESHKELSSELKKQKETRLIELEEAMRNAQEEYKEVGSQKQKADSLLKEAKTHYSKMYEPCEEKETDDLAGILIPQLAEKSTKKKVTNSAPRFMNSTSASRERQNVVEKEFESRARILKSWYKVSIQTSLSSHSIRYSDPHFRFPLRNSKMSQLGLGDMKAPLGESTKCNISYVQKTMETMVVASNIPNSTKGSNFHRKRRMSDFV
ncbi:kinesin-like protein KIN-14U [Impatiens glandulifera]|uniref:kinesin-like protein KIN-14U n=1 Tax=Impatiens glandulifera TaxID=253017 RepID=UPI001FB0A005|nr:kinesin-like protein KIN-14U [Impatiens glandulifera]